MQHGSLIRVLAMAAGTMLGGMQPMALPAAAQTNVAAISGVVTDTTGALVSGAAVSLVGPSGALKTVTSGGLGEYTFAQLAAGRYEIRVSAPGFSTNKGIVVDLSSGRSVTRNIELRIAMVEENVEVSGNSAINTDPSNSAGTLTVSGDALQTLSDDPDELAQDIGMLAGPSAGPEGGEVYVDGFSGARLPAKSSIREIRVNQNPFSAEFDRLGYGRIEILTKPGADQLHGEVRFNFNDSMFNARNPFAPSKPDYQRRMFEATVGGPLGSKTSFTVQAERRDIGQFALINATVLDPGLNPVPYVESIYDPRMNTEISGRIDRQFGASHTLIGRYEWEKDTQENAGLDSFSMPSRAFSLDDLEQTVQLTETAVLSPRVVNEVKFQYRRSRDSNRAVSSDPAVQVPEAFVDGGTSMSLNGLRENRYELQELVTFSKGRHTLKFGGRFRVVQEDNSSADDYNGMFTFATLDSYAITQAGLANHLSPEEIRAQGGGASQFTISTGNPMVSVTQFDVGLFAQNDWRVRQNLTLSGGLRFEKQTNIDGSASWGPRLGFAWGIPSGQPDKPIAILRAGWGAFYDRIREGYVMDAMRLDGVHQQQYLIPDPDFYPNIPDADALSYFRQDDAIRKLAPRLRAPQTSQFTIGLERQFPRNTAVSISYLNSRSNTILRSQNINAPLPTTDERPLEGGNVYVYESNGHFQQHQLIANVNARLSQRYTLFGNYAWGTAESDSDGAWSFPARPYNMSADYGRAGFDVRYRAMFGASITGPFGFLWNPFAVLHTGGPFDITLGEDLNQDSIFNDRPTWATDPARPSVVKTKWGAFDTDPIPGQTVIPRNLGDSPSMIGFNMRLSRAFGFGPRVGEAAEQGAAEQHPHAGPGGGPGGHYHGSDAVAAGRKYSLTLTISARNLLNTVNLDTPVGNLSSPVFGTSTALHGFGPGSASANRTIELQARFAF